VVAPQEKGRGGGLSLEPLRKIPFLIKGKKFDEENIKHYGLGEMDGYPQKKYFVCVIPCKIDT